MIKFYILTYTIRAGQRSGVSNSVPWDYQPNTLTTKLMTNLFVISNLHFMNVFLVYIQFHRMIRLFILSYHLLISPPATNLSNTLKIHTGENKIDR